jgi:Rrf2 family nitric oxide-sensitive transcriptional repressor
VGIVKLTFQADYALRVLLQLAVRPGEVLSVGEIAVAYGVSSHHLAKVAQLLGKLGYIEILRGASGGLRLAVDPARLRIGEVVRRAEPSLALVECFDEATNTCPIAAGCTLKGALEEAQQAFLAVLDRYTLADCVQRPQALVALLGRTAARRAAR